MMTAHKHNKSGLAVMALVLSASLSACAVWSPTAQQSVVQAPTTHVKVVPLASTEEDSSGIVSPQDIQRMAALQLRIEDFPLAGGDRRRWQFELAAVEDLIRRGKLDRARPRLAQLDVEVRQASRKYFQQHGQAYLQRARQFAYLNDSQAQRLRAVEVAAQQGHEQQVYQQARSLVRQLWSATGWVTVERGDSLTRIAARPQVYDNGRLWPLLKSANKGYFYRSNQPQAGWRLRYPRHPTLDEVFAAVEDAVAY